MLGFHSIERGTLTRAPLRGRKAAPAGRVNTKHMHAQVLHVQPPPVSKMPFARPPPAPSFRQQQSVVAAPTSEHTKLVDVVNRIWDITQQSQNRTERDLEDLRQQQSLLANRHEEAGAELSTLMAELASLKQRLSKTLAQAEGQLHAMERASMPAQVLKDLSQLQVDSNWMYATVTVAQLFFYAQATTAVQPSGSVGYRQRVLVLYKTTENDEGLWMQIRHASAPDRRFWIRLTDAAGKVTVGNFELTP